MEGEVVWNRAVYGYDVGSPEQDLSRNDDDSAPFMPRSVVTSPYFDWSDDRSPRVPWHETVTYEAHVKGITARHPDVPVEQRGTYAGLWSAPVIEHLKKRRRRITAPIGAKLIDLVEQEKRVRRLCLLHALQHLAGH